MGANNSTVFLKHLDMETEYKSEKVAFESKEADRGYTVKCSYLIEPSSEALVEIFKNGQIVRRFLFPAYKIWNIAAHFSDIVDGEIEASNIGYRIAASDGLGGNVAIKPVS